MTPSEYDVVIIGAGPTGLMLAGELALAGVRAGVVETRSSQDLVESRAGGLHSRTIEILDQRGIAERFLSQGQVAQVATFAGVRLDISSFPTRHPYGLGLWQNRIERILADWVGELHVPVLYGQAATHIAPHATGVDVELSSGGSLRAAFLVGCDGGRSLVRKVAGIQFPGWDPSTSSLIAEVEMTEEPEWGIHRDPTGIHAFGKEKYEIRDGKVIYLDGPIRVMVTEQQVGPRTAPTLHDLTKALIAACGTDYGLHSARWITRFTDTTRQAASYRKGRMLLAGDAAHVNSPDGGQGLNIGVQDAVNLGWKLAQVVKGVSSESLLDTYHSERHPVAARILRTTMAAVALRLPGERIEALREELTEIFAMEEPRTKYAAMMSGLDIRYDFGNGHPLLGRRMPDLDIVGPNGASRVATLLHSARPVLITLDEGTDHDIGPWADRVRSLSAVYRGPWQLPVVGTVTAPTAVLIRPDGHVAWVGEGTNKGLHDALGMWFGAAQRP